MPKKEKTPQDILSRGGKRGGKGKSPTVPSKKKVRKPTSLNTKRKGRTKFHGFRGRGRNCPFNQLHQTPRKNPYCLPGGEPEGDNALCDGTA